MARPKKPEAAPPEAARADDDTDASASLGGASSSADAPAKKRRKRRKALTEEEDVAILRAVLAIRPHHAAHGHGRKLWQQASDRVVLEAGSEMTATLCKGRFDNLVKRFAMEQEAGGLWPRDAERRELLLAATEDLKDATAGEKTRSVELAVAAADRAIGEDMPPWAKRYQYPAPPKPTSATPATTSATPARPSGSSSSALPSATPARPTNATTAVPSSAPSRPSTMASPASTTTREWRTQSRHVSEMINNATEPRREQQSATPGTASTTAVTQAATTQRQQPTSAASQATAAAKQRAVPVERARPAITSPASPGVSQLSLNKRIADTYRMITGSSLSPTVYTYASAAMAVSRGAAATSSPAQAAKTVAPVIPSTTTTTPPRSATTAAAATTSSAPKPSTTTSRSATAPATSAPPMPTAAPTSSRPAVPATASRPAAAPTTSTPPRSGATPSTSTPPKPGTTPATSRPATTTTSSPSTTTPAQSSTFQKVVRSPPINSPQVAAPQRASVVGAPPPWEVVRANTMSVMQAAAKTSAALAAKTSASVAARTTATTASATTTTPPSSSTVPASRSSGPVVAVGAHNHTYYARRSTPILSNPATSATPARAVPTGQPSRATTASTYPQRSADSTTVVQAPRGQQTIRPTASPLVATQGRSSPAPNNPPRTADTTVSQAQRGQQASRSVPASVPSSATSTPAPAPWLANQDPIPERLPVVNGTSGGDNTSRSTGGETLQDLIREMRASQVEQAQLKQQVASLSAALETTQNERSQLREQVFTLAAMFDESQQERAQLKRDMATLTSLVKDVPAQTITLRRVEDAQQRQADELRRYQQEEESRRRIAQIDDRARFDAVEQRLDTLEHNASELESDDAPPPPGQAAKKSRAFNPFAELQATLEKQQELIQLYEQALTTQDSHSHTELELSELRTAIEAERTERTRDYVELLDSIKEIVGHGGHNS